MPQDTVANTIENSELDVPASDISATTSDEQVEITNPSPDFYVRKHKGSRYIVEYRRDLCTGAVVCSLIAPNTFAMDDENKAVLIHSVELDSDDVILAAAQSCPALAIIIKDAETGEQIFPPPEFE